MILASRSLQLEERNFAGKKSSFVEDIQLIVYKI